MSYPQKRRLPNPRAILDLQTTQKGVVWRSQAIGWIQDRIEDHENMEWVKLCLLQTGLTEAKVNELIKIANRLSNYNHPGSNETNQPVDEGKVKQ